MPPKNPCQWFDQKMALGAFASFGGKIEGQSHIRPLHWYVACRLVVEGGFLPQEITPHPPFRAQKRSDGWHLTYDPAVAKGGERTLLGGLKTKNVDVVVVKDGLGPVISVSCKGATGAYRNLTNRMEESVGECTNLHITYPAMVAGYLFVMRAHRQDALVASVATEPAKTPPAPGRVIGQNDIAIQKCGEPVESVVRFHNALRELTGRRGIRNDVSRYEAVSLVLVDPTGTSAGEVIRTYPTDDSLLRFERFFETLYLKYDERYVYSAPDLKGVTRRKEWSPASPILKPENAAALPVSIADLDYAARIAVEDADEEEDQAPIDTDDAENE